MTLVSEIITDAYRQGNLVAIGATPTSAEMAEGLRYLARLVKSVFGNEVGDELEAFPIGRENITNPSGYPWWENTPSSNWFVPKNLRLMCNLTDSINLYLHPRPDNGSRVALVDVAGNLSTHPVTLHGNGRLIEGVTSLVLDTDSLDAEWFYRDDRATWVRISPLTEGDEFPFPEEFDDFFITMLAIRLNPANGVALDPQSDAILARARRQLRARYTQHIPVPAESGLIRLPRTAVDRDSYRDWGYGDPQALWARGWPFY